MMKQLIIFLFVALGSALHCQTEVKTQIQYAEYFSALKKATAEFKTLWGVDLYGPLLLVNPVTRRIISNMPDSAGTFKLSNKIYSGVLPKEVNIANTAVEWNGRRWAMVMLPLPKDYTEMIALLAHELFHVSQPALGFKLLNTENNHLNRKEGRIYLRLELECLKKAATTFDQKEQKDHLLNALTYRKYRHSLYENSDSLENCLEVNEGLAEYTGYVISNQSPEISMNYFSQKIDTFFNNPTYVRSFAYQTIPVYGFLLRQYKTDWNKRVKRNTNLTDFFIKEFAVTIPSDLNRAKDSAFHQYNGDTILHKENIREEKRLQKTALYMNTFIQQPHVEIAFEKVNVSFDPRDITPLEDKGSVYPTVRVTDNWGILTVKNGALISQNWDKISITLPLQNDQQAVKGDGWILELNEGYALTKAEATGNYILSKK